jgi:ABC-type Zn2+ transport system substrate-binding protein/surface adhesin
MEEIREFGIKMRQGMTAEAYQTQIMRAERSGIIDLTHSDSSDQDRESECDQQEGHSEIQDEDSEENGSDQEHYHDGGNEMNVWRDVSTPAIKSHTNQNLNTPSKARLYSNLVQGLISPIDRLTTNVEERNFGNLRISRIPMMRM